MADTTTTNLLLTKPEVGASTDTWGTKINSDLDSIDALFDAGPLLKVAKGGTGVGTSTGTGSNVLSASPTLTGTVAAAAATLSGNLTLSGGTANGVTYLNGSKVLTSGSALVFDGTNLQVGGNSQPIIRAVSSSTNNATARLFTDGDTAYIGSANTSTSGGSVPVVFQIGGSEQMRLTSTGLGIGTTSPDAKLDVTSAGTASTYTVSAVIQDGTYPASGNPTLEFNGFIGGNGYRAGIGSIGGQQLAFYTPSTFGVAPTRQMTLNESGNLGIGTSSPSAKLHAYSTASAIVAKFDSNQSGGAQIGFYGSGTINGYVGTSGNWLGTSATDMAIIAETSKAVTFFTGGSGTERMRLDSSGNLGLGVTPSAWDTIKPLQSGNGSFYGFSTTEMGVNQNMYYASGAYRYITSAVATAYRQISGVHSWHNAASGTAGNAISFTQAMTLDASGNLVIGNTSASARLHIDSGSTSLMSVFNSTNANGGYFTGYSSSTAVWDIGTAKQTLNVGASTDFGINVRSGFLALGTGNTERARITSAGDFLVGATSTLGGGKQTIYVPDLSLKNGISIQNGTAHPAGAGAYIVFYNSAGGTAGYINQTGTTTVAYTTTSDYRLKENITPMTGALAKVAQLKPVTYKWKSDGLDSEGFIAHELAEVCPQAVVGEKDAVDADGNPKYQGIDTSFLVATLTAAIQEQQAIIESLKARLDAANL